MIRNLGLVLGAASSLLALTTATAVYAQETTGTIRGRVTDDAGAGVAGATVTLRHAPSGTTFTTTTSADGVYVARGLRVGGPYEVTVRSSAGERTEQVAAIGVGDPVTIDVAFGGEDATLVEELVAVAGRRSSEFGSSSNVGDEQIANLPSISRDLKDVARLDPFAMVNDPSNDDALSFAGVNSRLNQLTVDGIRQNDEFGLNNNGYPTQRSPISLDAVESVNVSAAPFSVINNGFIGGSINAVTKSGGNEFSGSAFFEKSNDSMIGDEYVGWDNRTRVNGVNNLNYGKRGLIPYRRVFDETVWGATIGGPIIKDRLFFFLSYEKFESEFSLEEGPTDAGFTTEVPRITPTAVDTFQAATIARYGYDPLSYVEFAPPVQDEKYLAKIDWNINDKHRLSATYQETVGNSFNGNTGAITVGGNSLTQPRLGLESSQYNKDERLTTYNVQVNSQWTDAFSTELRYGYKETETTQIPLGGLSVGQVTVNVADLPGVLAGTGTPQIQFGADNFRHDNYLYSENTNFELIARYSTGIHDILGGLRSEKRDFLNVFVSQSLGTWTFASYADFLSGTPSGLTIRGAVDPNGGTVPATFGTARDGAVDFGYDLNSAYLEDTISVNSELTLTAGLRYDWFKQDDRPTYNANFESRQGFANTSNLDGVDLMMPRFGFDWRPGDWRISGGVGLFSAIGTNVQVGNPFGNDGARITNATGCTFSGAGRVTGVTDLSVAPSCAVFTPGSGNVVALDPNFEVPSAWKYNLSFRRDFVAPYVGDFTFQADLIRTEFDDALYYTDLRAVVIGPAPDGRPVYGRSTTGVTSGNQFDLMLTNLKDGGKSDSAAVSVSKFFSEGLLAGTEIQAAYTYTQATDGNPMTSSQPDSSYVRFASSDHNNPALATSDYEIRHRFTLNANWAKKIWGDNETSVNLFLQHRSGMPFSYVYHASNTNNFDNDFGNVLPQSFSGALGTSNQLFYVPTADANGEVTLTSDPRVTYAPGFNLGEFNSFLRKSGLMEYSGKIAPRNAFRSDNVTTMDIRLSQEFSAPGLKTGKFKAYMDIENFGNLLNSKWGVLEQYPFYRGVGTVVLQCGNGAAGACAAPGAVYTYSTLQQPSVVVPGAVNGVPRRPLAVLPASVWQAKLGLRFDF